MGLGESLKTLSGRIGKALDRALGPKPDSSAGTTGASGPPPMGADEADVDAAGFPPELR